MATEASLQVNKRGAFGGSTWGIISSLLQICALNAVCRVSSLESSAQSVHCVPTLTRGARAGGSGVARAKVIAQACAHFPHVALIFDGARRGRGVGVLARDIDRAPAREALSLPAQVSARRRHTGDKRTWTRTHASQSVTSWWTRTPARSLRFIRRRAEMPHAIERIALIWNTAPFVTSFALFSREALFFTGKSEASQLRKPPGGTSWKTHHGRNCFTTQ